MIRGVPTRKMDTDRPKKPGGRVISRPVMRKVKMTYFRETAKYYGPALSPILFFLTGFIILWVDAVFGILSLAFEKEIRGIIILFSSLSIYGILPLLILSYATFHLIARPLESPLRRWLSPWHRILPDILTGIIYGTVMGTCIVMFLKPDSLQITILMLLLGIVVGISNWLFYKKLSGFNT